MDEFVALVDLWGFSDKAQRRIRAAIANERLGKGPWLARYLHQGRSRVDDLEALARQLFDVPYAGWPGTPGPRPWRPRTWPPGSR